jgi:ankyrin repeat protein
LTPLALACQLGDKEGNEGVVKALLDFGADPNHAAEKKQTSFLLTVLSGGIKVTRMLLVKSADMKSLVATDTPPLQVAPVKGHAEMCKFLVQEGDAT